MTATPTDIDALARECREQISALPRHRGLLRPRLQSPNDLELERSRLVRSPLAIVALFLLRAYQATRDWLARVAGRLFPRPTHITGRHLDSVILARFVFAQRRDGERVPIHHLQAICWGRTWWLAYRRFAAEVSDRDGQVRLPIDLRAARRWWIRRVWLEVYHTGNHRFEGDRPVADLVSFTRVPILKGDLVGTELNLGLVRLFYWEYRDDVPMARVVIKNHDRDAPQRYARGRVEAIERQFVPIELIKLEHLAQIRLDPDGLSIAAIQRDYPESPTVCMEKKQPGITRGDDWFGRRFMNGMYAATFDRDPQSPDLDLYWTHHHWGTYEKTHDYAMPDVTIRWRLKADGFPEPVSITLTGPLTAHELDQSPVRTFTPEDGERWLQVKRIARVSGALYTELASHLAGTHLNTEQYAIAAYRNLRQSPLTTLLFPHLKEVVLVDHTADRILVGTGYVTEASALTPAGINQMVTHVMGTLDWRDWRPMRPLSDAHAYARAANVFWDMLQTYVTDFFEQYAAEIQQQWYEVYRFSHDLVTHSAPFFLCSYLRNALGGDAEWYAREHRMDERQARPLVGDQRKAVSPITEAADFAATAPGDWDNLKQVCCYAMFQATFGHTWANSQQYMDISEVLYNSLGLRFGDGPDGVLAPESDLRIAPDLTRATQMMWWANMLSRTSYGRILANEDGDVNPRLIAALQERRAEFERLDVNVDQMQSRVNI